MMQRRDVLRLVSLSALAVAGGAALAACGGATTDAPGPRVVDPVAAGAVQPISADMARVAGDEQAVPAMVAVMHTAGGRIFGSVGRARANGNVAISPYSVLVAMALTLNGAEGTTLAQLAGLYGDGDPATINGGLNALTAHIESLSGSVEKRDGTETELVLDAANELFGQQGVTWQEPFLETLATQYGAGLQTVDYADPKAAAAAINGWTAEQTRDKITEIVPAGALDAMTRLVLVNTLYLKAPWETPFVTSLTSDQPFTRLDGSTVQVPMMDAGSAGGYLAGVGDGWSAVQLGYAGRRVAMTLLLPDADRYDEIEADVATGGLPDYLGALRSMQAVVRVPPWTFRTQAGLDQALADLGVVDAFDPTRADFSAMTVEEELFVSGVLHEVFIAVDEEGTEAAAATAVLVGIASAPAIDLEFVADRPYLFVIHDVEHGTPLFLGRVLDPTEA